MSRGLSRANPLPRSEGRAKRLTGQGVPPALKIRRHLAVRCTPVMPMDLEDFHSFSAAPSWRSLMSRLGWPGELLCSDRFCRNRFQKDRPPEAMSQLM